MTSGRTRICVALLGGLMCLWGHAALAKPLSSEECAKLVSEHAELAKKGIEQRMDLDPATAAAELDEEALNEIERFLFVEGQIRFRCPEVKLAVPDPPKPEKEEEKAEEQAEKPSGPSVPLPVRKPAMPARSAG